MGSLSLRALLISSVLLTGIVPVVATSVYLQSQSKQAMIERSEAQLDANRVGRQEHVEHYLDMVRDQNSTLAHDLMTVEAMSGFRSAFPELGQLVDDQASAGASQRSRIRERVSGFYTSSFATEYANRNGESIDSRGLLPTTSAGLGAQYAYIANSPYPLGEKDKLERADSGMRYDALHERYHAIYRDFLQRFGYYDIFLVEPVDGTIVYSVFKELDYGTSLFNGPYRDTNFAEVTRKAMALPPGQTAIVDYKQYKPSYDAAASFVAAPIYDADVLIGVLVFQMPVDRLNSILLEETGLGETGETLLLGQDGLFRSQSRFSEANSILNASIDSSIIALASSGEVGTATVYMDGSEYITSYAPLEHAGLDWLMIARIKSSEALSVVSALQQTMLFAASLVALIVSAFGFFLARWLYNKLGGDPQEILAIAEEIGAGDLSPSEDEATRTGAYKALVTMRAKLRDVLGKSNQISREVQTGATELSDGNMGLSERTEQQAANLEETASSTEELTSTVRQNADNARSARDLAHETSGRATKSGEVAAKAIEAMTDINSASEKISNIIGVIDEIAFQTNLLALNAAVEAARAGEQGRGFAVVATEVRQLAGRSASAAREIKDLIEDSVTKVKGGTELVQKSGDELNHIVTAISQLTEIVSEISSASEEQAAGIDQINQALIHMDSVTQQNAALVEQAAATSKSISDQSTELSSHISYFDTGVDHHEGHSVSTARAPVPARAVASAPRVAAASGQPTSSAQPAPAPVSDDGVWEEF